MNFGSYFFGVLSAIIYDHLKSNHEIKLGQNKLFRIVFYSLIPIAGAWILSGHVFYHNYYEEQDMRIWSSLFAAVHRNFWSVIMSVLIVGMSVKYGCKYSLGFLVNPKLTQVAEFVV